MSTYLIGDVQGCFSALQRLLHTIDFTPSRDTVYLLGDLVNRGPASAEVLRYGMQTGDAIRPLLGNHDLHLLATAHGVRPPGRRDTLQGILQAPDCVAMLDWLAQQPLARHIQGTTGHDLLMVHAGVLPQWDLKQTLQLADEVHGILRGRDLADFLHAMYGNEPDHWDTHWTGHDRLRVIVNTLTRIRFCTPDGRMDFASAESAADAPEGLLPWFDCPNRQTADITVAFGHWSTLGLVSRPRLLALDTGCVWGGCLTAVALGDDLTQRQVHHVHCEAAQTPG